MMNDDILNNKVLPQRVDFDANNERALYSLLSGQNVEEGKKVLELARKIIMMHAKKSNYDNIDSDVSLDIIQTIEDEYKKINSYEAKPSDSLPGFDFSLLMNKENLNEYIRNLVIEKDHNELEEIIIILNKFYFYVHYLMVNIKNIIMENLYPLVESLDIFEKDERYVPTVFDVPSEYKCPYSEEELGDFLKKINAFIQLQSIDNNFSREIQKVSALWRQKLLDWFNSDQNFIERLNIIMNHDSENSTFYFHGTQFLQDAPSIMELGLAMTQDSLDSTAVRELDTTELLLYRYGNKTIGKDAVVIIDVPRDSNGREMDIVRRKDDNIHIPFTPSGNQGLEGKPDYIVDRTHIVGYVDKKNRKVIFNPNYVKYDQFKNVDRQRNM